MMLKATGHQELREETEKHRLNLAVDVDSTIGKGHNQTKLILQ